VRQELALSCSPRDRKPAFREDRFQVWLRNTTSYPALAGSWTQIASSNVGRPAMASFAGGLRVYYSNESGGTTTLRELRCTTLSSCQTPTVVSNILNGSSAAVAASESELHVVIRSVDGRVEWRRLDVGGAFTPIGGVLGDSEAALTNRFEDRFGSFSLFTQLEDGNLWRKGYNRYFKGRLANLPRNDYDRDGRADYVIVRDGTWWVRPSSGLPDASFAFGGGGDVFLSSADYDGNGVNDIMLYRPSDATWYGLTIDRYQAATGAPTALRANGYLTPVQFGMSMDRPVPGDYDGDWVTDEYPSGRRRAAGPCRAERDGSPLGS
jgi:hypothetical protein